jgi:hypothetical protein
MFRFLKMQIGSIKMAFPRALFRIEWLFWWGLSATLCLMRPFLYTRPMWERCSPKNPNGELRYWASFVLAGDWR